MTHFVAENLEYKIKISSPVPKKDTSGLTPRNSTQPVNDFLPRQFLVPSHLTQIDSNVLNDIEVEAQYLAASVDNLTENLCNLLHSVSFFCLFQSYWKLINFFLVSDLIDNC